MSLVYSNDGRIYNVPREVLDRHRVAEGGPKEEISLWGGQVLIQMFWISETEPPAARGT